jgi:hypothetical protein
MGRAGYENGIVEIRVWVDNWQMQCCGDPFAVGDEVSWKLQDRDSEWLEAIIGADLAHGIDKAEEHHEGEGEETTVTVGIVGSIHAVHCRYAPLPGAPENHLFPVPGSGTVTMIRAADGWTADHDDLKFAGYVVQLTGVQYPQLP